MATASLNISSTNFLISPANAGIADSNKFPRTYGSVDPDLFQRCRLSTNFNHWERELTFDENAAFILTGISAGFKIVTDVTKVLPSDSANYSSALKGPAKLQLDKLFSAELEAGIISKSRRNRTVSNPSEPFRRRALAPFARLRTVVDQKATP